MPASFAIVMPVFNEGENLQKHLGQLRAIIGPSVPVYVVDGGSTDRSWAILNSLTRADPSLHVLSSGKGRAVQMNAGALAALQTSVSHLLFLHADTVMSAQAWQSLLKCLTYSTLAWGRFDVQIEGRSGWLPVVAWMMNQRSRLTRISTGDQGIFMHRSLFERVGGYVNQPLMEDIEISRALKRQRDAVFLAIRERLITSGRRWDEQGAWSTIVLMWHLRFRYWRGDSASALLARYRDVRARKKTP